MNNEDYNIRSPERTKLLTQIKEVIGGADVSPAFWAGCQLADTNRLQTMAKMDRHMITYLEDPLCFMPMQCEFLGYRAFDTPTVNRDSTIAGFEFQTTRGSKEAQTEF